MPATHSVLIGLRKIGGDFRTAPCEMARKFWTSLCEIGRVLCAAYERLRGCFQRFGIQSIVRSTVIQVYLTNWNSIRESFTIMGVGLT